MHGRQRHQRQTNMVAGIPSSLSDLLCQHAPLAIALSGGIDSRFLLHAAKLLGLECIALHATGSHIAAAETAYAMNFAAQENCRLLTVPYSPLNFEAIQNNTKERCYHCKKLLIQRCKQVMVAAHYGEYTLCEGSNYDDTKVFRPGSRALVEENILSPLLLAHFSKMDIRASARKTGLPNPEQQPNPCLLTRFAYNTPITIEKLSLIESLEEQIAKVYKLPFRIRFTPEPLLQCTQNPSNHLELQKIFAQAGIKNVHMAITPKISGFFDQHTYPSWPLL
ncbi:MAG: ATP-dependent sacrificial sulfur transferase LarE [Desulfovibrio sp.]|nr:ATP-dependent sacrificial sulfur transferase LarE [Desulfovibrio sp.]